jgi:hypothetical protein
MNSIDNTTKEREDWENAASDDKSELSICPEPSYADRIDLALDVWRQGQNQPKPLSARRLAKIFRISKSTLQDRINRAISRKEYFKAMQQLSPGEEEALRDWMLAAWGWPVYIWQLHAIASALLLRKGDTELLGINRIQAFLKYNPTLSQDILLDLTKSMP